VGFKIGSSKQANQVQQGRNVLEGYEYYAFRFLTQWYEDELALYTAISAKPADADVRKALSYFQVSRNFRGIEEPGKLAFITQSLQRVREESSSHSPLEKVNRLAELLQKEFGQYNVSAASKLLWLSYRWPFIICDSRATKALKRDFRFKSADASYEEYVNAWRKEFAKHEGQIREAAKRLPEGRRFMRAYPSVNEGLLEMVAERWFIERVFDVLLWDVGQS
jgi:hypothetical protein